MRTTHILGLLALVALESCAPTHPPAPKPSTDAPPVISEPSPDSTHAAAGASSNKNPAKVRKRKPAIDAQTLVGMTEDQARQLLGDPDDVRQEPPALVWVYASDDCQLQMYFYPEVNSNIFKTLNYDVTPSGHRRLSDSACVESVRAP